MSGGLLSPGGFAPGAGHRKTLIEVELFASAFVNNLRSELEADRLRPDRIENPGDLLIGNCFFGGGFGVAGFGERGLSGGGVIETCG